MARINSTDVPVWAAFIPKAEPVVAPKVTSATAGAEYWKHPLPILALVPVKCPSRFEGDPVTDGFVVMVQLPAHPEEKGGKTVLMHPTYQLVMLRDNNQKNKYCAGPQFPNSRTKSDTNVLLPGYGSWNSKIVEPNLAVFASAHPELVKQMK